MILNNREQLLDLNRRLVAENPGVLGQPENFIVHVSGVYDKASELAQAISRNYPLHTLDPDEVSVAAGLHDIGRPLSNGPYGQLGHEIRSWQWIRGNVKNEGIVDCVQDAYRIAQMALPHSSIYEQWALTQRDPTIAGLFREEFGPLNPYLLVPRTWHEAIVSYADLADNVGATVDPVWKLNDAIQRYKTNPAAGNTIVSEGLVNAFDRLSSMCHAVERARDGKLSSTDFLSTFSFL